MAAYEKMDPIEKAEWCAALRGGDYKQQRYTLCSKNSRPHDHKYCCLGVRLVLLGYEPNHKLNGPCFSEDGWIGRTKVDPAAVHQLIRLNDDGKTFAEIADWIEANL